jgi:ureidoglycolate lyase
MLAVPFNVQDMLALASPIRCHEGRTTPFPMAYENAGGAGRHVLEVIAAAPKSQPLNITHLERHPHSAQSFIPVSVSRWLVVLAPSLPDGSPDIDNLKCFLAGQNDAICIGQNVWHAPLTVIDQAAEFAMLMWRRDEGENGILYELSRPIAVEFK